LAKFDRRIAKILYRMRGVKKWKRVVKKIKR
jgi:hypothetical protein